jgi:hypothetical protein
MGHLKRYGVLEMVRASTTLCSTSSRVPGQLVPERLFLRKGFFIQVTRSLIANAAHQIDSCKPSPDNIQGKQRNRDRICLL